MGAFARCVFCKGDSSASRSVEHILPESLGNVEHILPPGVVCDGCNNYFARGVEKPFLESPPISLLRFEQAVPSKRGKVPPAIGVTFMERATVRREPDGSMSVEFGPNALRRVLETGKGTLIVSAYDDSLPNHDVLSRFLAKVAVEALAGRLLGEEWVIEHLVNEPQLDPIRAHARYGNHGNEWPVHVRRIYPANWEWNDQGDKHQVMHEWDILLTDWGEWFFVLAVFGLEMTINYGGPYIEGYRRWLEENGGKSPLYTGKNAAGPSP